MIRIVKIADIELEHPLFVKELFSVKHTKAKSYTTLAGSRIVFESIKRDSANNITLESLDSGWLKEDTIIKIINLADNVGVKTTIEANNGTKIDVRFRLEEQEVITHQALFEGSDWYKVTIKLARI